VDKMKKNALHKIMDEHFEQIEREHPEQCFNCLPELDYEDDLFVYHCLRDYGCSQEEIDRLCRPENREECDRIMRGKE
jgi:hypothetical protein